MPDKHLLPLYKACRIENPARKEYRVRQRRLLQHAAGQCSVLGECNAWFATESWHMRWQYDFATRSIVSCWSNCLRSAEECTRTLSQFSHLPKIEIINSKFAVLDLNVLIHFRNIYLMTFELAVRHNQGNLRNSFFRGWSTGRRLGQFSCFLT